MGIAQKQQQLYTRRGERKHLPMIRGELTCVMQGSRGPFSCSESFFLGCPGVPGASLGSQTVKRLPTMRETWVPCLVGKTPWRRKWQPTPGFLPGEFHGQRSLALQSRARKELDTTERLHFLMVQWLRIHLAMQRTPVRSLAQEDPTRHRAVGPIFPNDWAHTPQPPGPTHHNTKAHTPQPPKPTHTTTPKPTHHNTKAHTHNTKAPTPQPPKPTHHSHQSPHSTTPKPTHYNHQSPHTTATKTHTHHNTKAHTHNTKAPTPQPRGPTGPEPEFHSPRRHCGEKSAQGNERDPRPAVSRENSAWQWGPSAADNMLVLKSLPS